MPTQRDCSPPPLSPTQGQPWLLASPLPAWWPHGSLGPRALGKHGLSTHRPKCCCAGSHRRALGVGGWRGVGRARRASGGWQLPSSTKSLMLELRVPSLSTRRLLGRTARALSRAGGATSIATSSGTPPQARPWPIFPTSGARAGNRTEPPLPPGLRETEEGRASMGPLGSADHHGGQGRVPAQARWTEGVPSIKPPAEAGVQLPSAWCFLFDKIPLHGGPERLNKD